jgi:phosphoglycolate phosphatase-like HAD superfamily hydrolase
VDFLRRLEAERVTDVQRFQPVAGAPELLDQLCGVGVTLGIATGGWRMSAELKLATAGLPTNLLCATSDDAEARIDIFSLAWARATAAPIDTTVLVGDSVLDVATARQLGWRFLGVGTGVAAFRLRDAGATIVVPDYSDLAATDMLHRAQIPVRDGAAA